LVKPTVARNQPTELHDTVPNDFGIGPKSGRKTFADRTNSCLRSPVTDHCPY
jgi:hypothetical protein